MRRPKTQLTSHKSNLSSVLLSIVDSYSALLWVTWETVTVVDGIPCLRVTTTQAG